MTEIPEHLLKRAQAARARSRPKQHLLLRRPPPSRAAAPADSRIPEALLQRSKAAKAAKAGVPPTRHPPAAAPSRSPRRSVRSSLLPLAGGGVPVGAGPGGHTQRLLTVVKSGSIQDVKATPVDKVHTWPHLLAAEFVSALAMTAFVFIFSVFVHAPLLQLANTNQTPNPSKAPWYFLGLQELLTYFHPMVAGVTLPGVGLIALVLAPYLDRNPSNKPEDRKFLTGLMTVHLMFWAVLVLIGSFFRGPGFNFVLPWVEGLFFEL